MMKGSGTNSVRNLTVLVKTWSTVLATKAVWLMTILVVTEAAEGDLKVSVGTASTS